MRILDDAESVSERILDDRDLDAATDIANRAERGGPETEEAFVSRKGVCYAPVLARSSSGAW